MSERSRFYGKYRGTVTDNKDPNNQGRICANVPELLEDKVTGWAMPCVPYAGTAPDKSPVGFFFIPPKDANVWIEFEDGDLDHPIWSGCFWDSGGAPAQDPGKKVLETDKVTITIDDTSNAGSITIELKAPMPKVQLVMDGNNGITLSCTPNKVEVTTKSVSVNDGALEVI